MKKMYYTLALPIILSPLVYIYYKWASLPETIAVHYGVDGQADRFGAKSEFLIMILVITGINVAIFFGLPNIYKIDPRKTAADNKNRLKGITLATVLFLTFISYLIIANAGKTELKLENKWIFSAVGLFWAVLGNYMYNIKPNYFAGIRLPWTLNDEENWRLTHRFAGKLWFAGGLLMMVLAFLVPPASVPYLFIAILTITVLPPVIYSYRLYSQKKSMRV